MTPTRRQPHLWASRQRRIARVLVHHPVAEVKVDTETGIVPADACRNCGTPVSGRFCGTCGQERGEHLVSLRQLGAEFVDDQFSLNARLPRTLAALFLQPGRLTAEYAAGRVVHFIRPFRLFLISTLAFFITLSFVLSSERTWRALEQRSGIDAEAMRVAEEEGATVTWQAINLGVDTATAFFKPLARRLQAQEDRINALPPQDAFRALAAGSAEAAARLSFLLLPLFALVLKLLHIFRRRVYAEHFVFALHFHAVAFATLTLALLVLARPVWLLALAYLVIYLLLALRRAYHQSWLLALAKLMVLVLAYAVILAISAVGAILIGVYIA